ncbi:MAG: hypothetical protein O7C56_00100 [Rickettsia endosymbiont of Ixodes persulcatus]|nr:hypothetical protein [Rickettsia endosymbiont of Ixodes persulcatus]
MLFIISHQLITQLLSIYHPSLIKHHPASIILHRPFIIIHHQSINQLIN